MLAACAEALQLAESENAVAVRSAAGGVLLWIE